MTVIARRFSSRPIRTSSKTWDAITSLICGTNGEARLEFEKVSGIASALIAEESFRDHPFVVLGSGPRLRVYCLYDEDSITAEDRNEYPLKWEPTKGNWKGFLPCSSEDIGWAADALKKKSSRFVAYDVDEGIPEEDQQKSASISLSIDVEGFKKL